MRSIPFKVFPQSAAPTLPRLRAFLSLSLSNRISRSKSNLEVLLDWSARSFSSFDVLVGDYFHRHNLEDLAHIAPDTARARAIAEGRELVLHVESLVSRLPYKPNVLLASNFSSAPSYEANLADYTALAHANAGFAAALNLGTEAFLRRFSPSRMTVKTARAHSEMYQLEELALFEELIRLGYSANVYPGTHLPVVKELVTGSLKTLRPRMNKMALVEIRFRSTQ